MGFSKQYGPVSLVESAGVFTVSIDESVSVGGGSVKGVVSASGKAEAIISGVVLADAGLAYLEAKFPSLAAEIKLAQLEVDRELASL